MEAADDSSASAIARDKAGAEAAELWCRNRLVLALGKAHEPGLLDAAE